MALSRTHEASLNGPVPTGSLPKSWPEASFSLGSMAPQPEASDARRAGVGLARVTVTECSSSAVTAVMLANSLAFGEAVASALIRSRVATTSAESNDVPSWNVAAFSSKV